MCLLITSNVFPDQYLLEKGEQGNGDGIGFAFLSSKGVRYFKGITLKEVLVYKGLVPGTPMLFHFRIATQGPKVKELCHPFPVTERAELDLAGTVSAVLGHNGNISEWREHMERRAGPEHPIPDGEFFSDSRALAWLVNICGINYARLFETRNRIAVLTDGSRPRLLGEAGIHRFGEWHEYSPGVFTSQSISRPTRQTTKPQHQQQDWTHREAPPGISIPNISGTGTNGGSTENRVLPKTVDFEKFKSEVDKAREEKGKKQEAGRGKSEVEQRTGVVLDDYEGMGYITKMPPVTVQPGLLSTSQPVGVRKLHSMTEAQMLDFEHNSGGA